MCVGENTISVIQKSNHTICDCFQGYYGERCEKQLTWYRPALITLYVLVTMSMVAHIVMSGFRFRYYYIRGYKNLSTIVILLNSLAALLRIIYMWVPSKAVYDISSPILVRTILNYVSLALNVVASALLIAFWYEVLKAKMRLKTHFRTKAFAIFFAVLMVVGLIPGIVFIAHDSIFIGIVFIVTPIFTNSVFIFGVVLYMFNVKHELMSAKNTSRKDWVLRWLLVLCFSWLGFMTALILTVVMGDLSETFRIIPQTILQLSYVMISFSIVGSLDFKWFSLRKHHTILTQSSSSKTQKTKSLTEIAQESGV